MSKAGAISSHSGCAGFALATYMIHQCGILGSRGASHEHMSCCGAQQDCHALPQEDGTALVSGFSGQLLKLFLADDLEDMTPESVMLQAIKGGKYDSWTVMD